MRLESHHYIPYIVPETLIRAGIRAPGLMKLLWRHLEASYNFLCRGEGNAQLEWLKMKEEKATGNPLRFQEFTNHI